MPTPFEPRRQRRRGRFDRAPLAFLVTFSTYGARLPGDAGGTVDRRHNQYGAPYVPGNPSYEDSNRRRLAHEAYVLDATRRGLVLEAIKEVCAHRGWRLDAAHVRSNHVHAVVGAPCWPDDVSGDFKRYASRRLNAAGVDVAAAPKRWARGGSHRYLWKEENAVAALRYVVFEQGKPMALYVRPGLIATDGTIDFRVRHPRER